MVELEINEIKVTGARKWLFVLLIGLALGMFLPTLLIVIGFAFLAVLIAASGVRVFTGRWPSWFLVL